jgi:hypothetical protein
VTVAAAPPVREPRSARIPLTSSEFISGRTLALKRGLSFGELLAELLRGELDRESGSHSVKA